MRWKKYAPFAGWCAICLVVGFSFVAGLAVRRAVWDVTSPIRFGDIQNGFRWAMASSGPQGYLNQYDREDNEQPNWGIWLDYAPLRLLLMDQWGHWARPHSPRPMDIRQPSGWFPTNASSAP